MEAPPQETPRTVVVRFGVGAYFALLYILVIAQKIVALVWLAPIDVLKLWACVILGPALGMIAPFFAPDGMTGAGVAVFLMSLLVGGMLAMGLFAPALPNTKPVVALRVSRICTFVWFTIGVAYSLAALT